MNKFGQIHFDKKNHSYKLKGKKLTSVTSLISTLEPEVDWDEIARKKGEKEGIEPTLLLSQWKTKGQKAMAKGSNVHQYIERRLKHDAKKDAELPEMMAWDNFWDKAEASLEPIQIEWIIGDYDLGLGGTIDCLFLSNRTNKYHILDWKTGENFRYNNPFQNLKEPFNEYESCEFIKYSLQLSAYKLILKRNTNFELGDSYVIHLQDDFTKVKCLDLSSQIESWLNF